MKNFEVEVTIFSFPKKIQIEEVFNRPDYERFFSCKLSDNGQDDIFEIGKIREVYTLFQTSMGIKNYCIDRIYEKLEEKLLEMQKDQPSQS